MRTIQISTDVFAKIWSHRIDGEEDENSILKRLLGLSKDRQVSFFDDPPSVPAVDDTSKIRWRDDVKRAVGECGGQASLRQIYDKVREIRRHEGRSLPANVESIVRRELETNSSDSDSYTGRFDWFRSVGGIGKGVWALRESEGA
jgi:hypothetical protein